MVSPKDLRRARLAFDYRVVKEMARSSSLIDLQAFSSRHDLEKRRRPICDDGQGETAGYYLVHYNVRSLVGRGKYHTGFDVVFDLMSEKTYPKARANDTVSAGGIIATSVSRPIAWSPHFLGGVGTICLGSIWRGADHTLLAHVIIHVARLLNWDEPIVSGYGGWNATAVKYWRRNHHSKPISPGLAYPTLPSHITHSVPPDTSANSRRRSVVKAGVDGFQILKVVNAPTTTAMFKTRYNGVVNL